MNTVKSEFSFVNFNNVKDQVSKEFELEVNVNLTLIIGQIL